MTGRTLVAGVDSSTQSCKVVVRDARTGELVRSGWAAHPDGTEVDPAVWWSALQAAVEEAGGLDDVDAVAVAGQQHGMVALDEDGAVVRPALLWNDTRSADEAARLVDELGPAAWARRTGSVPVASYTVTKLAWLAAHEPEHADRTAAVALPHDWLTWRLSGSRELTDLVTDRSDASGTGYWDPVGGRYDRDLLARALGHDVVVPRVLGPHEAAGRTPGGSLLGPGAGDNAGSALGLGALAGDLVVSVGTSGVVCAVSDTPVADESGLVSGFADATGRYLPLVATLNASRVLDAAARLAGVDLPTLDELAASAPAGSGGLVLVPYLEGERTPNLPRASGSLHGLTLATSTPAHLARAAVEAVACSLADALDAVRAQGVDVGSARAHLVGGGARSGTLRQVLADVLDLPVLVPEPGEYVADGAARQAAWVLAGGEEPPAWDRARAQDVRLEPRPGAARVRDRYAQARAHVLDRLP